MLKPHGIIPPIITPMTEDGKFNESVFITMIHHLIEEGVHGIFPLGTTGEFYAFSDQEIRGILKLAKEESAKAGERVGRKIDVYAGATHITTRKTVELVQLAEDVGVDAVSVLTPMFISQSQEEIYRFYKTIAENTALPIIIYNNKPKTNVTLTPETVARLAQIKNIVGIKDSTGDFTNTEEYIRLTRDIDDFSVLLGRDTLIYAGLCYGATGAIASCANIAPRIAADIYDKYMAGDLEGALEAQFKLAPLRIACNMGSFPEVIKEGLMMQGYPVGKCLEPIAELKPAEKEALAKILQKMDLL
jgi:4-hydroxy-tetrahydrodipicolinate synthase